MKIRMMQKRIAEQSEQLKLFLISREKLACLKQELSQLVTEQEYFDQYVEESDVNIDRIEFKKKLSSKRLDGIVAGVPVDFGREKVNKILV